MLDPKSLKRRIEYREEQKLIEEGFIESEDINLEQIKLEKVYEPNGNWHNLVYVNYKNNF